MTTPSDDAMKGLDRLWDQFNLNDDRKAEEYRQRWLRGYQT